MDERLFDQDVLSESRGEWLEEIIRKKLNKMPIYYNPKNLFHYKDGKRDGILTTAKNMLDRGVAISLVQECTGLSREELEKLSKEKTDSEIASIQ